MHEAASDAGKAAQPPQRSLPGSAQTRHTTCMPQFPAARRSGAMLPGSRSPCSETNGSTLGHGMGFPTRNYSTPPAALCFLAAAGGADVLLINAAAHTQKKHLAAAQQATKHHDFDAVTESSSHVMGRNCSGKCQSKWCRRSWHQCKLSPGTSCLSAARRALKQDCARPGVLRCKFSRPLGHFFIHLWMQ